MTFVGSVDTELTENTFNLKGKHEGDRELAHCRLRIVAGPYSHRLPDLGMGDPDQSCQFRQMHYSCSMIHLSHPRSC